MHVLLAEDRAAVRSALRFLLEQESGVIVDGEASDTSSLLAQYAAFQPDLVLFDWELPGSPATDLLHALRARRRIVVIALSGQIEARNEALAAGVDAFVSKGEPPERLLETLRAFLRQGTFSAGDKGRDLGVEDDDAFLSRSMPQDPLSVG